MDDDYGGGSWWAKETAEQEERQDPERLVEPVMSDSCGVTLEYVMELVNRRRLAGARS